MSAATFPPSTRSNAEAMARAKGYTLTTEGDTIVAVGPDGIHYTVESTWPAMLAWIIRADRLDHGHGGAA